MVLNLESIIRVISIHKTMQTLPPFRFNFILTLHYGWLKAGYKGMNIKKCSLKTNGQRQSASLFSNKPIVHTKRNYNLLVELWNFLWLLWLINSFCYSVKLHYVSKNSFSHCYERSMENIQAKCLYTNLTIKTNWLILLHQPMD